MLIQLNRILKEMEVILDKYTKIKKDMLYAPFQNFENRTPEQQKALFDFVFDFRGSEYKELERIFKLPLNRGDSGFELWDRYFANGKTGFPEMKLFRAQARVCRDKWKECPKYKKVNNGEEKAKESHADTTTPAA